VVHIGVMVRKPLVFLSSTFKDDLGLGLRELPLRLRILEARPSLPVEVWAYEHIWGKEAEGAPALAADTIIDRCFEGIRDCDLFVFIVTGRHGTGANYVEDNVAASYLELELFAAAILRKPILILHYSNREPEPALLDALSVLKRAFASNAYIVGDERELFEHFVGACGALAGSGADRGDRLAIAALPEGLSLRRSRDRMRDDLADPRLLFLDGRMRTRKTDINPENARALIEQVAAGVRDVGGERRVMPHGVALFRLWAALRELMNDRGTAMVDPLIAPLWDHAMGLWATKASWLGVHGHVWMGPLAAIHSQMSLREQMAGVPSFRAEVSIREPLGARASALYSIAQRMDTRRRKLFHFRQVVELTTRAMAQDAKGQQGLLSIRAHATMHMGRLGLVWKLWEALADFRQALDLRERSAASEASVGEAKTDLGFCLILTGRPHQGLALLEEGVRQLRSDDSANGKAFLARGLRKQLRAARLLGKRELMRAVHQELHLIASQVEAMDQLRDN
jgi:hypothetical protein